MTYENLKFEDFKSGQQIKVLRAMKQWSQRDLKSATGISLAQISRYEQMDDFTESVSVKRAKLMYDALTGGFN